MSPRTADADEPAAAPPHGLRHYATRWLGGLVVATLLAWGLTLPFLDSVMPYVHDDALSAQVPPPGHTHRHRSEGWGDSRFGRFGVGVIEDVRALSGPSVALWGDSYVEALQVDDPDKVAQQVTRLTAAQGRPITGVGIGGSGRAVADYVALIPRYEALFSPTAHVIVMAHTDDVLPDGQRFLTDPYRLAEVPLPVAWPELRAPIERLRLQLPWRAIRNVLNGPDGNRRIRLRPGPVARPASEGVSRHDAAAERIDPAALDFLLGALRGATQRPLIFVYAPAVPRLRAGRVDPTDPGAAVAALLAERCRAHGIVFLDLSDRFRRVHAETGAFPRGFANSVPSRGHWNALGHRLVAEAITAHLLAPTDEG